MDIADILGQVLTYLLLAAITAAGSALALFLQRLAARQGEGLKRDYLDLLASLVGDTVSALDQTVVKQAKEAKTWNDGAGDQVKQLAIKTVLGKLTDGQRALLERALGDLRGMIDDMVERQVRENRQGGFLASRVLSR